VPVLLRRDAISLQLEFDEVHLGLLFSRLSATVW
jgi:hypothetical protein